MFVRYKVMRLLYKIFVCSLVAIAFLSSFPASAETITRKQASKIAQTFFNASYGIYVDAPKFVWNGRQLTTDRLFSPFYVYNHPKGGFVIIAADSKAFPILGYSRTENFDRNKLKDEDKVILEKYAHEIELIRYDSRQPLQAMAAWRNLPLYINKMLNNPYDTPQFNELSDSHKDRLEAIDRSLNAIMMPSAVEFDIYDPDNYRDYTLDDVIGSEDEDIPFKFFEDFLKQIKEEENTRQAAIDEVLSPTKPIVSYLGGAHVVVKFPSQMKMAVIYSMQGMKMLERYYNDTDTLNLDLSALPTGFYALLVLGEDGEIFGAKIAR